MGLTPSAQDGTRLTVAKLLLKKVVLWRREIVACDLASKDKPDIELCGRFSGCPGVTF